MNCLNGTRKSKRHSGEGVVRNRKNTSHMFDTDSSLQSRNAVKIENKNDNAMDVDDPKEEENVKDKENKFENGVSTTRDHLRSKKANKDVKEETEENNKDDNNENNKTDSDELDG